MAFSEMSNTLELLIHSMNGVVWEVVHGTPTLKSMDANIQNVLGFSMEYSPNPDTFWNDHAHPEDRERVISFLCNPKNEMVTCIKCRLLSADGNIVFVENYITTIYENDVPVSLRGIMVDVSAKWRFEQLEKLDKDILSMYMGFDKTIEEVLSAYMKGIEGIYPQMLCSILKVSNNRIFDWASPSLPSEYLKAIKGLAIGPDSGSCGTAAYTGQTVIVSDIEKDEKWIRFKDIALKYGLRACWSRPVIDAKGNVIATFAMYYDHIKEPAENELAVIDRTAHKINVILQLDQSISQNMQMNTMFITGEKLAGFGTWEFDIVGRKAKWSESLLDIYGENPETCVPSFQSYIDRIHPDDKLRVLTILKNAHENNTEEVFEERIITVSGSIKHLRSWFSVKSDAEGNPVKYNGSSLDISREVEHRRRMQEIAWQQSHVVRAPLARILGLVSLIKDGLADAEGQLEILDAIEVSAHELDDVVRQITKTTELKD